MAGPNVGVYDGAVAVATSPDAPPSASVPSDVPVDGEQGPSCSVLPVPVWQT